MATWHLDRARLADVPALQRLIDRSVRLLGRGEYSPAQIEASLRQVYGVDRALILDGTYFVARASERIVGSGGWSRHRTLYGGEQFSQERNDELLDPRRDPARIRAMFVDPDWARQGIGAAILRRSEEDARAAGFRSLELMSTLTGISLYSKHGYRRVEEVQVKLEGAVDFSLVRMTKKLKEKS